MIVEQRIKTVLHYETKMNDDMVSNIDIYPLIRMIWNLATIQHSCVLRSGVTLTTFRIKGDNGLMDYLGACYDISERLSKKFPELSNLRFEIGN